MRTGRFAALALTALLASVGVVDSHSRIDAVPVQQGVDQTRGVKPNNPGSGEMPQPGRYVALVIGIDEYRPPLPRLKTAVEDAKEVARVLADRFGFETKLLLNATRDQIKRALGEYRRTLPENASLLIYYAGHGFYDREADRAYWWPSDAEQENNANWIIADEITTDVKVIPAGHILIVSDSCYSGGLTRDVNVSVTPQERERYLRKAMQGRSRTLISSGGNEPVADSGRGGHSVFANAILRGLQEMEAGVFTARDLFDQFILVPVAGKSNQTPEFNPLRNSGHDSGDFVFFRKKDAVVTPAVNEAVAYANRGKMFQSNNRHAEAAAEFLQAIRLEPRVAEYHDYLAQALMKQDKWAEAEVEYRQAVKLDPNVAWYHTHLAGAFVRQSKYEEAEAELRQAVALDPGSARQVGNLGGILVLRERYAEAEAAFRKAIAMDPNVARELRTFGWALYSQRKYADAETELRRLINLEPAYATAHLTLALVLREHGWRVAEAEAELQEAARLDPKSSGAVTALTALRLARHAESLLDGQKSAEAEVEFRQAVASDPTSLRYRNFLGISLYRQHKYAEAEAEFIQVAREQPNNALYHGNVGVAQYALRKYADAETSDRRAVALDPNNAGYRSALGNTLFNQQKYAEAEVEFTRAVALEPKAAGYQADLGATLYRQGKYAASEAAHRQATLIDPKSARFRANLSDALLAQHKYAEAEEGFRQAVKLDSSVGFYYSGLGRALEGQDKLTEAEAAFAEAVRRNPNDTDAQERLKQLRAKKEKPSNSSNVSRFQAR